MKRVGKLGMGAGEHGAYKGSDRTDSISKEKLIQVLKASRNLHLVKPSEGQLFQIEFGSLGMSKGHIKKPQLHREIVFDLSLDEDMEIRSEVDRQN